LLAGARLVFRDGTPDILAYPQDRVAYGRLCRLLSAGKIRAPKGECYLTFEDLLKWQEGLLLIVLLPHPLRQQVEEVEATKSWNEKFSDWNAVPAARLPASEDVAPVLATLKDAAPGRVWLGVSMPYLGDDLRRLRALQSDQQRQNHPPHQSP